MMKINVQFSKYQYFDTKKMEIALKGMANLRGADKDEIVVEMIKHYNIYFKEMLLFNGIYWDRNACEMQVLYLQELYGH